MAEIYRARRCGDKHGGADNPSHHRPCRRLASRPILCETARESRRTGPLVRVAKHDSSARRSRSAPPPRRQRGSPPEDQVRMKNSIVPLLERCGITGESRLEPYFPKVRDRDDVAALRCPASGVIVLSRTDHMDLDHYREAEGFRGDSIGGIAAPPTNVSADARRRLEAFGDLIRRRRWLDVGAGYGVLLDLLGPEAATCRGIEPNRERRADARKRGHDVVETVQDLDPEDRFDVISLFHVFEHLTDPIAMAEALRGHLAPGGRLIVEVPHARDALLDTFDCEAFRGFTLWSEHLVLHTRESLTAFLREAGFETVTIQGVQRYPVANHLHWLRHGAPAGQTVWPFLDTPALRTAYEQALAASDRTDTIVAIAQ